MQQPCKTCGYESPEADKFCRHCGSQLSTESEFSSAPTINQPNPPVASVGTGRFPPSAGDAMAGETVRYYYSPQYAPAPVNLVQPPNFVQPQSVSPSWFHSFSRFMKGAFLFLVFAGLSGATAAAVFFSQEASRERQRRYELEMKAQVKAGGSNANGRAQNAWGQMEEALALIHEAEEKAASAGATLSTGGERAVDVGKYAYPGAQVEATIGSHGNEALSQLTHQNFDTVRAFYERQFGKPVIQAVDDKYVGNTRKRLLFQSSASPPVLIKIEEVEESQVKITILHSLLRFPSQ